MRCPWSLSTEGVPVGRSFVRSLIAFVWVGFLFVEKSLVTGKKLVSTSRLTFPGRLETEQLTAAAPAPWGNF